MKLHIRSVGLPLSVYREVAAHLGQVDGVTTELLPQRSSTFDYQQSQIDSLIIHTPDDGVGCEQVQRILTYYGDRYGTWETIEP